MRAGSPVVVRQVEAYLVVIDPVREAIEVRRADDRLLERYPFSAARRLELFVGQEGAHRLVLTVASGEAIDFGTDATRAVSLAEGKRLARHLRVSLDIRSGDFHEAYVCVRGPRLSRIHEGRQLIEAELVDPIDPQTECAAGPNDPQTECARDELNPWADQAKGQSDGEAFSMDDLLIEIQSGLSSAYDDGPFAEPRVRTAPEVEAVYPLPMPLDPPPMSAEAEAQVRASHRPPRQAGFERRGLRWLRAALKALTA